MTYQSRLNFLGKVYVNFKRSEIAYKNYIQNNKIFLHAKILRICNEEIRNLLIENCSYFSGQLFNDSLELISHSDIWIEKWDDLQKQNDPKLYDEFLFKNEFTFPRNAAKNIEKEFLNQLKKNNLNNT